MKSILVIGIGRFGKHLCMDLVQNGNDVMAVDEKEDNLEDILSVVTSVKIADCTREEVLRSFGVSNFDICFVCIGTNFQSSLEITSLLKEMGAPYVISKATRDIQAKFLLRNGADEVVYPDRDIAKRIAIKVSANHVYDYMEMGDYSIYEIQPLEEWVGKSIKQMNFRVKYNANILGIKKEGQSTLLPDADHIFTAEEHLMVIGKKEDIDRIVKQL
ncbi:MAG: TrkA family potassium uptake protein [Lachnospiraceae bacterium]|jgi:trk system potassium uptake protein TrkA|nr:TrkA family potassium uptake protein [Lachnospiraceae bacterium]